MLKESFMILQQNYRNYIFPNVYIVHIDADFHLLKMESAHTHTSCIPILGMIITRAFMFCLSDPKSYNHGKILATLWMKMADFESSLPGMMG